MISQTTLDAILKKLEEEEDRFRRVSVDVPNSYAQGCADGSHWQTEAVREIIRNAKN